MKPGTILNKLSTTEIHSQPIFTLSKSCKRVCVRVSAVEFVFNIHKGLGSIPAKNQRPASDTKQRLYDRARNELFPSWVALYKKFTTTDLNKCYTKLRAVESIIGLKDSFLQFTPK